jgi:hypothetical protein
VQAKNGADKKRIANQSSRVQVRKIAIISKKSNQARIANCNLQMREKALSVCR